jgi:hypothetical protein
VLRVAWLFRIQSSRMDTDIDRDVGIKDQEKETQKPSCKS